MGYSQQLEGKRVALLVTDGAELAEVRAPVEAVYDAGADVEILAARNGEIGLSGSDERIDVDTVISEAHAGGYDGLMIPGTTEDCRADADAIRLVREFVSGHKPVAASAHGCEMLAEAGVISGRRVTGAPADIGDLKAAGAEVLDRGVVVDGELITCRGTAEIPGLCAELVGQIAGGPRTPVPG